MITKIGFASEMALISLDWLQRRKPYCTAWRSFTLQTLTTGNICDIVLARIPYPHAWRFENS